MFSQQASPPAATDRNRGSGGSPALGAGAAPRRSPGDPEVLAGDRSSVSPPTPGLGSSGRGHAFVRRNTLRTQRSSSPGAFMPPLNETAALGAAAPRASAVGAAGSSWLGAAGSSWRSSSLGTKQGEGDTPAPPAPAHAPAGSREGSAGQASGSGEGSAGQAAGSAGGPEEAGSTDEDNLQNLSKWELFKKERDHAAAGQQGLRSTDSSSPRASSRWARFKQEKNPTPQNREDMARPYRPRDAV